LLNTPILGGQKISQALILTKRAECLPRAAGVEKYLTPNFAVSAEYVYNRSFIPLIMLDRVADRDVDTDTLILSGILFF
jgi:hypothetical protein